MFRTIVLAILFVELGIPLILALFGSDSSSGCLWIGLAIILIIIML